MKDNRGGAREGAGRKSKSEEKALIERLSPMDDRAFEALELLIEKGDIQAIKLFMQYRFGMPSQNIGISGDLGIVWQEVKKYENK